MTVGITAGTVTDERSSPVAGIVVGTVATVVAALVVQVVTSATVIPVVLAMDVPIAVFGILFFVNGLAVSLATSLVGGFVGAAVHARRRAVRSTGGAALVGCAVGTTAWILMSALDAVVRAQHGVPLAAWSAVLGLLVSVGAATAGGALLPTARRRVAA